MHEQTRLNKYLAQCGVCSRREADKLIEQGRVLVNGIPGTTGQQVSSADHIQVNGKLLQGVESKKVLAFYKPVGVTCTEKDRHAEKIITDMINYPVRVTYAGRLDKDSEGLILLTNDGDLMNDLLHPSREVEKEYLVKVSNRVTDEEIRRLRAGVQLDDGRMTSPADVHLVRYEAFSSVLLVSIHEGRNRQVRRMFAAVGHEVVSLKRVGFATIKLHDLPRGQWRRLTDVEVKKLKELK